MNITQNEMLRRLNSPHNLSNRLNKPAAPSPTNPASSPSLKQPVIIVPIPAHVDVPQVDEPHTVDVRHAGMHKGTKHAPQMLKDHAAILAGQGVKTRDIQAATGLSPAQIHAAKNQPNVQDTLDRVRNLALDKLMIAMGLMTQDKFENAKLEELAKTASSLARVAEKMLPKETNNNTVQFIMHAPQAKQLSQYDVIDV